MYEQVIRMKPDYVRAFVNRAIMRKHQGDLKGALDDYNRAIALNPKNVRSRHNRAILYRVMGRYEKARSTLAAVLTAYSSVKAGLNRHSGRFPGVKRRHVTNTAHWAAMARFILADMQFGRVLQLQIPTKLNFDPSRPALRKRSQIRFATWAKNKAAALVRLRRGYEQILLLRQPQWTVAAMAPNRNALPRSRPATPRRSRTLTVEDETGKSCVPGGPVGM